MANPEDAYTEYDADRYRDGEVSDEAANEQFGSLIEELAALEEKKHEELGYKAFNPAHEDPEDRTKKVKSNPPPSPAYHSYGAETPLFFTDGHIEEPALFGDCGYDLPIKDLFTIPARGFAKIPMGARVQIPYGYWGLIIARSSVNQQGRLMIMPGVIDAGYRGPLFAFVHNMTDEKVMLLEGMAIAQLILIKVHTPSAIYSSDIADSDRGHRGFGSTGKA